MTNKLHYGLGIVFAAASLVLCGNENVWAQATKQLKEPAIPKVVTQEEGTQKVPAASKNEARQSANDATTSPARPGTQSESYSVIIENKIGPDGKRIKTKKVWKNGTLVEDRQDVVDGTDIDADASVILSDGETAPGMILRSERSGDELFDPLEGLNGTPSEMIQRFEQQFRRRQEEHARRMEEFRQLHGLPQGMSPLGGTAVSPRTNAPVKLSQFWIGASIMPVPEILASQLDLPAGTGALVVQIVPDSPAAKGGIAKYDVLVKVGKNEIKDMTSIGDILDREKGAPQTFEIYRKGKPITLNITPEKRPDSPEHLSLHGGHATGPSQIRVVRPGIIIPPDKSVDTAKPGDAAKPGDTKPTAPAKPAEVVKPKSTDAPTPGK